MAYEVEAADKISQLQWVKKPFQCLAVLQRLK